MAKRRDSKGRFKKGRKTNRRRSRKRGMGSIITVRRKGMSGLDADTLMPALVGGGLAAFTSLAARYFVNPAAGTTQSAIVKWAPALGLATGGVAALGLYMMGGADQATRAFISAAVVSLAGLGSDYVLRQNPSLAATITSDGAATALAGYGYGGMGAIVPEYSRPTGAVVMEAMGPGGQRAGSIGSYGETVSLAGVNVNAFGTPGFNA